MDEIRDWWQQIEQWRARQCLNMTLTVKRLNRRR